jgi:hypothetical protein
MVLLFERYLTRIRVERGELSKITVFPGQSAHIHPCYFTAVKGNYESPAFDGSV